jgi:hypothetical protein
MPLVFVSELHIVSKMASDEGGVEWLYELLQDVQLEQFFTRIRDDLQVILCDEKNNCLKVLRLQFFFKHHITTFCFLAFLLIKHS